MGEHALEKLVDLTQYKRGEGREGGKRRGELVRLRASPREPAWGCAIA